MNKAKSYSRWGYVEGINEEPFTAEENAVLASGITAEILNKLLNPVVPFPDYAKASVITSSLPTTITGGINTMVPLVTATEDCYMTFNGYFQTAGNSRAAIAFRINSREVTQVRIDTADSNTSILRVGTPPILVQKGDVLDAAVQTAITQNFYCMVYKIPILLKSING